ncbi:hypothetical protein F4555_000424 [Mobiluncus mulieris]|uniref:Uncharacterized protein n=1 Tax=Mobiluncus mulieris TaxID=2052 RepID=A0A378PCL3_9ACTO|nr:hypothetical protein HMPREF9278_2009 [Mobiluncus mulieris FB024-16]MBB5845628.1 hypothetical protein [Mobiluncus mulieris]STO15705.1 Uncharacterised protein [Mobiluncus mulieris]STY84337.1 Uncharacterised protein [Mobiluncus mulieris]
MVNAVGIWSRKRFFDFEVVSVSVPLASTLILRPLLPLS